MATSDEGVRLRDKVTIVTGGASGIGRSCVELFGKHTHTHTHTHTLHPLNTMSMKRINSF